MNYKDFRESVNGTTWKYIIPVPHRYRTGQYRAKITCLCSNGEFDVFCTIKSEQADIILYTGSNILRVDYERVGHSSYDLS